MKRVVVRARGGPEVLKWEEGPEPSVGRGEVLVRTEAIGVAFGDLMRRRGLLAPPGPFTPGYDLVGRVEGGPRNGERVAVFMPRVGFGAYAEQVAVREADLVSVSQGVSASKAVALGLNYITARHILDMLDLPEGGSLLVHGAAGGVGTAMLELGSAAGLRLWGTASAGKHPRVQSYGATAIDYRNEDFTDVVSELDAVVDPIGGDHLARSLSVLGPKGTLVAFGVTGDVDRGYLGMLPGLGWLARTAMTDWSRLKLYGIGATHSLAAGRAAWTELLSKAETLHPVVGAELPFEEVSRAHRLLEQRAVEGKVVLVR